MKRNDIMKHRLRTARTVECLYCETELKPFRGLFDEDFCCREHRDKYFSSFRRSLNRLPALDIAPAAPLAESVSLASPPGTLEPSHIEALAAPEELFEERVTLTVEIPAESVDL